MTAEQRVREILAAEVADLEPSPAGWEAIRHGVTRRRRRRLVELAVPVALGVTVLALVLTVVVPRDDDDGHSDPAASRSPSPNVTSEPASPPASFVGLVERTLGRYRTSDGVLLRTLAEGAPGSIRDVMVDPSGASAVYVTVAGACQASIQRASLTDATTTELVPAANAGLSHPAHNGGTLLAYVARRCDDSARVELVLRDVMSGQETVLEQHPGFGLGIGSLSWSPDGQRLAVLVGDDVGGGADLIRVYEPGRPEAAVMRPREGCSFTSSVWQQAADGGRRMLTGQYCRVAEGLEARVYIAYTEEDGPAAGLSTSPLLTRGDIPITALDLDPSGRYLLGAQTIRSRGIELWYWDFDGNPVYIPAPANLLSPTW